MALVIVSDGGKDVLLSALPPRSGNRDSARPERGLRPVDGKE